jgi:hypothetical protein
MLKACLIIVIALGLAALAMSQLQVAPKIANLETSLATAEDNAQKAQAAQKRAEQAERQAKTDAESVRGEMADVQDKLDQTKIVADQQRARADELERNLRRSDDARVEAQRQLAQWTALGVDIPAVQTMKRDLLSARQEIAAINDEKDVLSLQLTQLEFDLSKYKGPDIRIAMPDGLKGSVVGFHPRWDFVVVDIGENNGVKPFGQMMVNRNGKLVGKIQITTVEPNQSIANLLPDWKQADIQIGDQVIY